MEALSKSIAETISNKLQYDSDKKAVIAYGLSAIFQMVTIFVITSVIGLAGGFWIESMVIFLSVGILRKSTGGAHSQTFQACLIISIFSISLLSFLSSYILPVNTTNIYIVAVILLVFLVSFIFIYKLAPVDSPAKPIVKKEKIIRLRKNSIATLLVYLAIALICFYFSSIIPFLLKISISLCFATLWQVFTLTKPGHRTIAAIDKKFK